MKFRLLLLTLLVPALLCCQPNVTPDDPDDPTPEQPDNPTPPDPEPDEDLPPEIKNGDTVLATNADIEEFITTVNYPERDYSETFILNRNCSTAPGKSDLPPTYCVKWTADASQGELTAKLWEGDWSQTFTIDEGEHYFQFTNLRPNADYHWEVKGATGKVMSEGAFKTTGHLHHLTFKSRVRNVRDLGGWKTKDGKTVKYRMVYRGGRLESGTLTKKGIRDAIAEGIRAQLDLRGHTSSGSQEYLNECALDKSYAFCAPCIEEGYSQLLKDDAPKVKQCFEFIVQCVRENKPVYFHCSLGRDRTGTISMVCLGILGVDEGDISKEYEITQFAPHGWATSDGEKTKMTRKVDYKGAANVIWSYVPEGGSFKDGMEAYLLKIGVSQKDIDDFRALMLE